MSPNHTDALGRESFRREGVAQKKGHGAAVTLGPCAQNAPTAFAESGGGYFADAVIAVPGPSAAGITK